MVGRIPIMNVAPVVDLGRQPAKATLGEPFPVSATVFREGHDRLGAEVVLTDPGGVQRPPVRLEAHVTEPNEYAAWVTPDEEGPWTFSVQAYSDPIATWQHAAGVKIPADVDVELMFTEGRLILERVLALDALTPHEQALVREAITAASAVESPSGARLAVLQDEALTAVLAAHPLRELLTLEGPYRFYADRPRALFGSWYEFFPRSEGAYLDASGEVVSGTLVTAAERLDAVAAAGFDVIYLPPIHPIGEVNRKGPNNTLTPAPQDPGSPWAIGSRHGGHDAVHPDLGTIEDFDGFVARAHDLGLEVALDLALQAAPDHPWVQTHPQFFTTRVDGTIAYAENPPKKYQDIYPMNFDNDPTGICREVLRVVKHWIRHGVSIFRVDNPHTKPVAFWEWLLAEVRRTHPEVIFLSEAFTKPAMMRGLGAVGFHQSYTYFTWRTAKWEIEEYLRELSGETAHLMRPNFFVNTPDILHSFLQYGGPAAFKIRAALAATSSPSWGVYAGYELFEHVAVKPGSEEYLDSEKYQIRIRDWARAEAEGRTLTPYLATLNAVRREHRALQLLRNLTIHHSDDENIIVYSKRATAASDGASGAANDDVVIVVINLDPHATRESTVHLDMPALGLEWGDAFEVSDAFTSATWTWREHNYVRLDPGDQPAHVLSVRGLR